MDQIRETIGSYDNGKDDEFMEDKEYNNESDAGAKSGDVKNDDGNNEKESTFVKLLTSNDRAPNNTDDGINDERPATNNLNSFLSEKGRGKWDLACIQKVFEEIRTRTRNNIIWLYERVGSRKYFLLR